MLGNFGQGLRKWSFALGWMLSGSEGNSVIWYLSSFFSKVRGRERGTAVTHVSQDWGIFDHFHGLDNVHVLSVFWYDYKDSWFCLEVRVSLSFADILWNHLCSRGECQGTLPRGDSGYFLSRPSVLGWGPTWSLVNILSSQTRPWKQKKQFF